MICRHLLVNKPWYIEREDAEKYLDSIIDTANFVLLEAQKIALVDDPMRTMRVYYINFVNYTIFEYLLFHFSIIARCYVLHIMDFGHLD